jgi:hypothetical protein
MLQCVTSGDVSGVEDGIEIEVSWSDDAGRRCARGLGAVADIAFEEALPAREIPSYHGQRHFPGLWWLATTGRHVGYESWLERDHLVALDFDRLVTGVSSQPFTLSWRQDGQAVSHTPDYFARLADGSAVVIDVRPAARVRPRGHPPAGRRDTRGHRPATGMRALHRREERHRHGDHPRKPP